MPIFCKGFGSDYNNIDSNEANEEIRQAYLDGIAEGRFEKSASIAEKRLYTKVPKNTDSLED